MRLIMSPFYGWKTKAQRLVKVHSVGKSQDIKQTLSFSSVQCSRLVQHPSLCDPMDCSTPGLLSFTNFRSLLTLMPIELVMPSNHLILCRPLLLPHSIFPASESFPMRQFFTSGGQSIGVSASAPILPMNIQDWFPLGLTSWISLQSKGLSRVFSKTIVQKHQLFDPKLSLWSFIYGGW